MKLNFISHNTRFGQVLKATADNGLTYEIHNKWDGPRGSGYAVFIRTSDGKSITGNTAVYSNKYLTDTPARAWCNRHLQETEANLAEGGLAAYGAPMPPKGAALTPAQRSAIYRVRRLNEGYTLFGVWARPENHDAIRKAAAAIEKGRPT